MSEISCILSVLIQNCLYTVLKANSLSLPFLALLNHLIVVEIWCFHGGDDNAYVFSVFRRRVDSLVDSKCRPSLRPEKHHHLIIQQNVRDILLGQCALWSRTRWPTFQRLLRAINGWWRQQTPLKRRSTSTRYAAQYPWDFCLPARRHENLKLHIRTSLNKQRTVEWLLAFAVCENASPGSIVV
jgi:hypothetical protein